MARNGSGAYNLPEAAFVYDTVIDETAVNSNFSDIAAALTQSIAKDGQTTITANLPMATYKHTGVGNASARTDYAAAGQVQDGAFVWGGTAGGTADALTFALTPAITAYATGQKFKFIASATNTGAATVAINGLAAKAIEIDGGALVAGAITTARLYSIVYDGTAFRLQAGDTSAVVGPALSTDNALPRWSGDTGKTIQNSGWTLSDADALVAGGTLSMGANEISGSNAAITGGSITGITDIAVADGGTGRSSHTAYAVLTGGTTATGAQQSIASVGTVGQVLTSNGAGALPTFESPSGLTSGTKQTASSSASIDFTSIPAGVLFIIVEFDTLLNSSGDLAITIGDSGGLETSGYVATSTVINTGVSTSTSTAAFNLEVSTSGSQFHGHLILTNVSGNSWVASHTGSLGSGTQYVVTGAGHKTLSGTLDRIRISSTGGTMSGDLNIKYQ